ncbi:MAG: glycosyltransferase family 4 protein [Alphaproteobacteria bacterium]|nr:glycosyltransferase family 4 protein [Alphaproteobacteria bacterium]
MTKRILFLAETAERLGSSVFLLDFLTWLKGQGGAEAHLLLGAPGSLLNDFNMVAETTVLLPDGRATPQSLAEATPIVQKLRAQPYELIFANTASTAPLLELTARPGMPVLLHVMEGAYSLRHVLGLDLLERLKQRASHFVAASSSIERELLEEFSVPREKLSLVPCATRLPRAAQRTEHEGFQVLGAGTLNWRKGPDLFVQLAAQVKRQAPDLPIRFVWAGKPVEPGIDLRLAYEARLAGVDDRVRFLGEVADMPALYAASDAFVLTSREEPLGLVCVEAAARGLPVLCFKGAGAAADFVLPDAGVAVPYLATCEMATALLKLALDSSLRSGLGTAGRNRALAQHDMEVAGPKMWNLIETTLS